jgi:hypothetical protein
LQNGEESRYEVRARVPQNAVQVKKRQCQVLPEISAQKPFSIPFTQASLAETFSSPV